MSVENPSSSEVAPISQPAPRDPAPNRILALVHHWMSIWDRNTDDAAPLLDLMSPEGFAITLVAEARTMTTIQDVKAWYSGLSRLVRKSDHLVESVDVAPLPDGRSRVILRVRAQVLTAQDLSLVVRTEHTWEVVDYSGFMPRIAKVTISRIIDA